MGSPMHINTSYVSSLPAPSCVLTTKRSSYIHYDKRRVVNTRVCMLIRCLGSACTCEKNGDWEISFQASMTLQHCIHIELVLYNLGSLHTNQSYYIISITQPYIALQIHNVHNNKYVK